MKLKDAMIRASVKYIAGGAGGTPPYWREVSEYKRKFEESVKSDSDND